MAKPVRGNKFLEVLVKEGSEFLIAKILVINNTHSTSYRYFLPHGINKLLEISEGEFENLRAQAEQETF